MAIYQVKSGLISRNLWYITVLLLISFMFSPIFLIGVMYILYRLYKIIPRPNYIIDADNDLFFLPGEKKPCCNLSDITDVISTQKRKRGDFFTGDKSYTDYYLQIIGEFGEKTLKFNDSSERNHLKSVLKRNSCK